MPPSLEFEVSQWIIANHSYTHRHKHTSLHSPLGNIFPHRCTNFILIGRRESGGKGGRVGRNEWMKWTVFQWISINYPREFKQFLLIKNIRCLSFLVQVKALWWRVIIDFPVACKRELVFVLLFLFDFNILAFEFNKYLLGNVGIKISCLYVPKGKWEQTIPKRGKNLKYNLKIIRNKIKK